jgi:hypothetical protein
MAPTGRAGRFPVLAVAASCLAPAVPAGGDEVVRRKVVADPQYAAGGFHRAFFGDDYRDLWTAPVTVEVLDLGREAGGLSPVRRVGGQQTKGLALKGADGRAYTFRGLEKHPESLLEEELRGTIVQDLLQDQMAAQHPGSELVARVLLDAADVPCPRWRLVVLPDEPALGTFQADFAGAVGMFAEYPTPGAGGAPGFRGATSIIDHLEMYARLEAGDGDHVDDRALLRARLVDILMGDWDRHRKQWRWAKSPDNPLWWPIPEDRDQAFSRYEGILLSMARGRDPRLQKLDRKYPGIGGLAWNARDQDRRLLVGLARDDFQAAARSVQARITDAVIDAAVGTLPEEWRRLDGARLGPILKARRDALPDIAERYYRHLAGRVDVYMTKKPEVVQARRLPAGDLDVQVAFVGSEATPWFQRRFQARDTHEVRLYTLDGDDKVVVSGKDGGIRVRVVGGPGADTLEAGGNAKLSDEGPGSRVSGASLDDEPYTPPPPPANAPWIPPRDVGTETWTVPWVSYNGDLGVFLGMALEHTRFGFRKHPNSSHHIVRAGYAFGQKQGKVEYQGEFRRENRSSSWALNAYVSGVEVQRFFGLGNETVNTGDVDFYKVSSSELLFFPNYRITLGDRATLGIGPAFKYSRNDEDEDQLINELKPYGSGRFAESGLHAALAYDARDSAAFTRRGFLAAVRGTYFAPWLDVESGFGQVNANANAYVSAGRWLTLAGRVGGKHVFGDYPFQEAAYLGGSGLGSGSLAEPDYTLRGYRARRFGGDSSAWANGDLRLTISRITLVVPAHWGFLGFADTGRVWLEGEASDDWHVGYGGGIWVSLLNYRATLSAGIAHSKEDDLFYVTGGFTF